MSAYDLRIYEVAAGSYDILVGVLRDLAMPMMPSHGIEPIGFWSDREAGKLYQVSRHADLTAVAGNWERFHADPRWAAGLKDYRGTQTAVRSVTTMLLSGIPGMPPFEAWAAADL